MQKDGGPWGTGWVIEGLPLYPGLFLCLIQLSGPFGGGLTRDWDFGEGGGLWVLLRQGHSRMAFLIGKIFLYLTERLGYCSINVLLDRFWQSMPFRGVINLVNTLQAYLTVRCHEAQTGGFIFFGGKYAL